MGAHAIVTSDQHTPDVVAERRPTLYATIMDIIDTEHADKGMEAVERYIPPAHHEQVAGVLREICRRSYVDGLRDGFVQGVEREATRS